MRFKSLLLVLALSPALHAQQDGGLYIPPVVSARGVMQHGYSLEGLRDGGDIRIAMPEYGEARAISLLRVLEHGYTIPLLPMVFFDDPGSVSIPERYSRFGAPHFTDDYTDSAFVPASSFGSVMRETPTVKCRQVLNILGYRLRRYPDASIALEGGYADEPGETEAVAIERAETVKRYLVMMWRIEPERVRVLPPRLLADSAAPLHLRQEARRVSVVGADWRVVGPVRFSTSRQVPTKLMLGVLIDPKVEPGNVREIELSIALGDGLMYRATIPGSRDSTRYSFVGTASIPHAADTTPEPVAIQVVVTTNSGVRLPSDPLLLRFAEERRSAAPNPSDTGGWRQIPFFEWRSPRLGPLQRMYADSVAASLRRDASTSRTVALFSRPEASEGFAGEMPEVMAGRGVGGVKPPRSAFDVPVMKSLAAVEEEVRGMLSTLGVRAELPAMTPTFEPKDSVRTTTYHYLVDSVMVPRMERATDALNAIFKSDTTTPPPAELTINEMQMERGEDQQLQRQWTIKMLRYSQLPEERFYNRSVLFLREREGEGEMVGIRIQR